MAFDSWSGHALLVDTDGERRTALTRMLADYGWRVTEAPSGPACIALLEDSKPDVVLADHTVEPLRLLERVREIDDDVPMLVMGPEATTEERLEALRAGAFDRVHRPTADTDSLLLAFERAAQHSRKVARTRAEQDTFDGQVQRLRNERQALRSEVVQLTEDLEVTRQRAEQADRAKSAFLANMSHELRTPLNAILGYAELLGEDLQELADPHLLHDLQRIRGAGNHLLTLIAEVLELARIEAGRSDLFFEAIDVGALLRRVADELASEAVRKHNTFVIGQVPSAPIVTDVAKLTAILDRIAHNANKFTSNGSVHLDAQHSNDTLEIRIVDTGIGISAEQRRLIFREFSQGDASTTRRYGGTGLGLTIASRLTELLGGSIRVQSVEGEGSTFTLRVPTPKQGDAPPRPVVPSQPSLPSRHVLLIDADSTLQRQMNTHLTRAGYRVTATASGVEGLRLARSQRPDLILLDVVLPDVDGWNLLMGFKRDPVLREIPVVLVTLADDRTRGLAVGASDFLAKPVRREALLGMMQRVVPATEAGPILIVEDDDATRDVTQRMLTAEGWAVDAVANGRLALEWLEANDTPSLILLDLMMPEVDGFHVITELQCRDDWRHIPVVVFTAMDVPPASLSFLERHVDSVIRKGGYGQSRMLDEVRELIERTLA